MLKITKMESKIIFLKKSITKLYLTSTFVAINIVIVWTPDLVHSMIRHFHNFPPSQSLTESTGSRALCLFFKRANRGLFFGFVSFFSDTNFTLNYVGFRWILTCIVGVDHLTTTTTIAQVTLLDTN